MKVVLIGISGGLVLGLALGRTLSSLVFGVRVRDPFTFVAVAVVLAGVTLAACAIPALRGSRINPGVASDPSNGADPRLLVVDQTDFSQGNNANYSFPAVWPVFHPVSHNVRTRSSCAAADL